MIAGHDKLMDFVPSIVFKRFSETARRIGRSLSCILILIGDFRVLFRRKESVDRMLRFDPSVKEAVDA